MSSDQERAGGHGERHFASIADALDDLREGKMVIVCDDEDRENEGDLTMAAQFATAERINFMAKEGRGLICLTLTPQRCAELNVPPMTTHNEARLQTAFTVSIEAREGVTTGISAADRGGERRLQAGLVVGRHRRQIQLGAALGRERQADEAATFPGHEVDALGGRELCGHREVALVLAVLVVADDDHLALAQVVERIGDGREGPSAVPAAAFLVAAHIRTPLPLTSPR